MNDLCFKKYGIYILYAIVAQLYAIALAMVRSRVRFQISALFDTRGWVRLLINIRVINRGMASGDS